MAKYETMLVTSSALDEEASAALIGKFKSLIEANGTIDSVDDWGKRRLAYPIEDETEGVYTVIKFTSEPDFPAELDRNYKNMQDRAFYERIGAKFQSERERQKITREHMAEQINISSKFLYEIESGRKGFSCEIFRNMCKYLHVNADYILEEDDVASSQMRIETMTRDFSIEEMNYLVKMIEGIREMRKAYEQNDKIG